MSKEIKYDKDKVCKRNFTTLDYIVDYGGNLSLIAIVVMLFYAIWGEWYPFMNKVMLTLLLFLGLSFFYLRILLFETDEYGDLKYKDDYAKIIEEEDLDSTN